MHPRQQARIIRLFSVIKYTTRCGIIITIPIQNACEISQFIQIIKQFGFGSWFQVSKEEVLHEIGDVIHQPQWKMNTIHDWFSRENIAFNRSLLESNRLLHGGFTIYQIHRMVILSNNTVRVEFRDHYLSSSDLTESRATAKLFVSVVEKPEVLKHRCSLLL